MLAGYAVEPPIEPDVRSLRECLELSDLESRIGA